MTPSARVALFLLCASIYLLFAPGRILFPDDEIVFQTTQSLWEDGDLAIDGIPKRTGELEGRPDGTFGWAPGVDGKRYGFFGHALSVVALPMYGLGKLAAAHAPETWRHAIRSDHYFLHRRSPQADWPRLFVSLTNCFVTAASVVLLAMWVAALGYRPRIAALVGLAWGLGTSAWAYAGTFLSEPLSATLLVAGGLLVTRYLDLREHDPLRARTRLWLAAVAVTASVFCHVLNLLTAAVFACWLLADAWRRGAWRREAAAWGGALAIGAIGLSLLGLSQWLRFGDPWQTGRYDHYSSFVVPGEGLLALLVGPGRSVLLYSPALIVALPGARALWRRHRGVATLVLAVFVVRWVFVASRSDWWGGWAIGPRYLLPIVPLLVLPLAEVLARATTRARQAAVALALALSGAAGMHLASHSIFEWMLALTTTGTYHMNYLGRSHWIPSASPYVGFFSLPPDTLSVGAWRLAQHGHASLLWVLCGVAAIGVLAAFVLARALRR